MVNFYETMQYAILEFEKNFENTLDFQKIVRLKKQDAIFAVYTTSAEYGYGEL